MTTKRWIFYTVIVGALPLIIRSFMLLLFKHATWEMFINPIDFVFLGLTLNITNINESHTSFKNDKKGNLERRENVTIWSIIFIIFLSLILSALYLDSFIQIDVLNEKTLKISSIVFCVLSLSYSFYIVKSSNAKK